MGGFLSFVKKETLHIVRDPRTMLIALLMPVVQILLFGFAISTEVNNVNVAVVAPRPGETIWDVGAGTGSVSVELAAAVQQGTVYAVECEAPALALIKQNRQALHSWNLRIVAGRAPQALADLPAPDAVFVGGSKGEMQAILSAALARNPGVRLCVSCIALETLQTTLDFCQAHELQPRVVQVGVSEARPMGRLHLMMAQNPVFLVTVHCDD